jgi:alkylation response protein AidB-like acyl-CoA dehydrogenase
LESRESDVAARFRSDTHHFRFYDREGIVSLDDFISAASSLRPLVAAHADEAEHGRRLPSPVVEALRDAQLMRLCVPVIYGGPEADPGTMMRCIEEIASADGAAGWCLMIASTTSSLSMYLPVDGARTIYGDPMVVTGGVFARNAASVPVDGGHRVTGRWMWGSGTQHCQWITGGALDSDGTERSMFFPAADVTIHDTWYTSGLRGTGSNDFSVDDAFVPDDLVVQLDRDPVVESALAAFPTMTLLALGVAAVSLGIGRHALQALVELAQHKRPQFSSRTIAQSNASQVDLAKAEAQLGAARAYLYDEVGSAWAAAQSGSGVSRDQRVQLRLAGVNAAEVAVRVADLAFTLGGGSSIFETSPLQRCMRDAHVVTQHIMVAPRLYETLGKHLFGIDIDARLI